MPKNHIKPWLYALFLFCSLVTKAQPKTDTLRLENHFVQYLPDDLQESSGLCFVDEQLISHNDGGNSPSLFFIKPKGQKQKEQKLHLPNVDWEAICSHKNQLFIGDFGNNLGQRTDLQVHQLNYDFRKKSFDFKKTFHFTYPEQSNFSNQDKNHNFDAESMVYYQSKLHIFTKNWQDFKTTHYSLSIGMQKTHFEKVESFAVDILLTDACIYQEHLYLLGYDKQAQIIMQVFRLNGTDKFFGQASKRYILGSALYIGQAEALAINHKGLYISTEALQTPLGLQKAKLYHVPGFK